MDPIASVLMRIFGNGGSGPERFEDRPQPVRSGTGGMIRSSSGAPVTSRYGTGSAPIESRQLVDRSPIAQAMTENYPTDQQVSDAFRYRKPTSPPVIPDEYGAGVFPLESGRLDSPEGMPLDDGPVVMALKDLIMQQLAVPLDDGPEVRPLPEGYFGQPEGMPLAAAAPPNALDESWRRTPAAPPERMFPWMR